MTKIDVAKDYQGSFIPLYSPFIYNEIKEVIQPVIAEMFGVTETNFLSLERMMNFEVQRGDNILNTCYQYKVVD